MKTIEIETTLNIGTSATNELDITIRNGDDNLWIVEAAVMRNDLAYDVTGCRAELLALKADGSIATAAGTVSSNVAVFVLDDTVTDVSGDLQCQISFMSADKMQIIHSPFFGVPVAD